jgi:hypothetical protein
MAPPEMAVPARIRVASPEDELQFLGRCPEWDAPIPEADSPRALSREIPAGEPGTSLAAARTSDHPEVLW